MSYVNHQRTTYIFSVLLLTLFTGFCEAAQSETLNNQLGCETPDGQSTTIGSSSDKKRQITKINITTGAIFDGAEKDLMLDITLPCAPVKALKLMKD
jgi:hypothetical protein